MCIRDRATGELSADQILDKYVQALGGAQKVAAVTSFAAKGTYQGYAELEKSPIEIVAKAPGQRVTIYKGTQGDTTGFDPFQAIGDGSGIWFSDYEIHGLWYWDPSSGLHKIVVKGVPGQLAGPNSSAYVNPAGSCM